MIMWPYIIVSIWHFLTATGFLLLAWKGSDMPRYTADTPSIQLNKDKNALTEMKYWKSVMVLVYIYFTMSCGLESFFQVSL